MQPLAPSGSFESNANTNLSTSISLTLLDSQGNDLLANGSFDEPVQFIIPRDPNAFDSSINWEYVSTENRTNKPFYLHLMKILRNNKLDVSVHLEIFPMNQSVAYWFIYKFDGLPFVNSSLKRIDGWSLFCPYSK